VAAGPGEVLKQVAELVGFGDAQVHSHARVGTPSRACSAGRTDALDLIELGKALRQRRGARGDGDEVEILDAVGLATRGTGEQHPGARAAPCSQVRRKRFTGLDRLRQQHARGRALTGTVLERRQHACLELRPEPAHCAQALVQCRFTQLRKRVDAEL
jgi:hypothetical protein